MVEMHEISVDQTQACMEAGDFQPEILTSKAMVAVILTQGWCPEWTGMKRYLEDFDDPDIDVWLFIYDHSPIFEESCGSRRTFSEMPLSRTFVIIRMGN